MAKSKAAKKKNEGKKKPSGKSPKTMRKLKQKATNKYNSKALESVYGSITRDSKNWGIRTRAMAEAANEGKPYNQGSRKRQRTNNFKLSKKNNNNNGNRKAPPPKPQFQLRMPPAVPAGQIPWWTKFTVKQLGLGSGLGQKKMKLLDEINVNPQAMCVLDHEMKVFSNYVQLSAKEIETRENLVRTIRKEARERFGIRDSDVKVFGSYAARPVCTFESDVDLVIWGLVENQHEPWSSEEQEENFRKAEAPLPPPKEPQPEHPNSKKQSKILKWKAAIDEFEKQMAKAAENGSDKSEANGNIDAKPAASKTVEGKDDGDTVPTVSNSSNSPLSDSGQYDDTDEKSSTNEAEARETKTPVSDDTASLFVIDRIGEEGEIADTKSDTKAERATSPTADNGVASAPADVSTDSDDDTADKLEGLKNRGVSQLDTSGEGSEFHGLPLPDAEGLYDGTHFEEMRDLILKDGEDEEEDDEQEEDLITTPKTRKRSHSLISLSSATTCSDNQMVNEDGLEVSFVTDTPSRSIIARRPQKLSDDVRLIVNSKLNQLSKRIRKTGVATSIELRKWARVPILNMKTRFGYECDIGVGGHNGNDTSAYAGSQISQHPSFAPVVMVLKILLNQHDLDKPFTGGLGSFKLYVLVASHIQQHLAFGGSSTASEILMTFFFRYGDIRSYRHVNPNAKTDLKRVDAVHCHDGGVVEVSQVFQIENCVTVFRACWFALMKALANPTTTSLLRLIVDAKRLRQRREAANSMVSNIFGFHSIRRQPLSQSPGGKIRPLPSVRYSTNHHGENKAISKLFKGGNKSFKKKNRGKKRKSF